MRIKIRDWDKYFEADRSRQWKSLKWVPIPNKQGLGYKKIMSQKNGPEIFGCWCSLVQQASLCDPRGDLSKYSIDDLSINTIIPVNILTKSIEFIMQNLDWIEVIENLDKNVNENDKNVIEPAVGSSILFNSIPCSSIPSLKEKNIVPPKIEWVEKYCSERNNKVNPNKFYSHYESKGWMIGKNRMKDWQAAVRTWEEPEQESQYDRLRREMEEEKRKKDGL